MADVIALRLERPLLREIDELSKKEDLDRSTIVRRLIKRGFAEVAKEHAVGDYREGKITISTATHRAGLTLWEFEKCLMDRGFVSDYSIEDLEHESFLLRSKR